MFFEDDFIDKVRSGSDIVELIGQYTHLKNSGRNYMGVCPFPSHKEKTPSFSVSADKQLYHCFGCGKSGNIFSFLRDYNGLNFTEAVEYLAKRNNIPIPEMKDNKNYKKKNESGIDLKKLNEFCRDRYQKALRELPETHPAIQYLKKRDLDAKLIETFQIGYAPDAWEFISSELKKKKFAFKQISELGLFKSKDNQSYYDVFRNRIMFPIISPTGDVLGFGGRVLDDSKPKYLNSPETSVFKKSKTFYGLYETAREIRNLDYAIVVEGYTDLIALYKFGFQNVIATLGTALTEDHAKLLKRYTNNIIVLFDGDNAGIAASEKAMRHLLHEGLFVKGIYLPDSEDPDSYLQKYGAEKMRALITKAQDLYLLYLDRVMKKFGVEQITDKMNVATEVAPVLGQIGLDSLRELYIKETSFRLGVDEKWLEKVAIERNQRINAMQAKASHLSQHSESLNPMVVAGEGAAKDLPSVIETIGLKNASLLERDLINVILLDESCLKVAIEQVDDQMLQGLSIHPLFEKIRAIYGQKPSDFGNLTSVLMSFVEPQSFLAWHLKKPLSDLTGAQRTKMVKDCISKLKSMQHKAKMKQYFNTISSKSTPEELEQFVNMKKEEWDSKGS